MYLEFISMVSHQTEEDLIRSCRKFINHVDFPEVNRIDFSVLVQCADMYICQDEEGEVCFYELSPQVFASVIDGDTTTLSPWDTKTCYRWSRLVFCDKQMQ